MRRAAGRLVSRALGVRPGEWRVFGLLFGYSAAATGGVVTVGRAVTAALFVDRLGPGNTAYLLILPAAVTTLGLAGYNAASARIRMARFIVIIDSALLIGVVLLRLTLSTPAGGSFAVLAGLYLLVEFSYTVVLLQLWTLALQVLDARQAKRLLASVGAGGAVASILAALCLASLAQVIGASNLLWIVVGSVAVCIVCARSLTRLVHPDHHDDGSGHPPRPSLSDDVLAVTRNPLLRAIAGYTIVESLLVNLGFFVLLTALGRALGGREGTLVAYLGVVDLVGGVVGLLIRLWLTRFLVNRYGVFAALALFPAAVALACLLGLALRNALWPMALLVVADPATRAAAYSPGLNLLSAPLPRRVRARIKPLFAALYAATFGVAGLIVLVVRNLSPRAFLVPLLALCACALALGRYTRRRYVAALDEALLLRRLDPVALDRSEASIGVLRRALADPDPLRVVHALGMLADMGVDALDDEVQWSLRHESPEVRRTAGTLLVGRGGRHARVAVQQLLVDPDETTRLELVRAVGRDLGSIPVRLLEDGLRDASPRIRAEVAGVLARGGDELMRITASQVIAQLASSDDPFCRTSVAHVLEHAAPDANNGAMLRALLDDPVDQVRLAAVRAAASRPDLITEVLGRLEDQHLTGAIVSSLAEPHHDDVLARLPGFASSTREDCYRALAKLSPAPTLSEPGLGRALDLELDAAYESGLLQIEATELRLPLLDEALDQRYRAAVRRTMLVLELLHHDQAPLLRRTRDRLNSDGPTRALAIELLTSVLARPSAEMMLPLVEGPPERLVVAARRRLGVGERTATERLAEMAAGDDPWLARLTRPATSDDATTNDGSTMTMTMVERVLLLKRAELFGDIWSEELAALAGVSEERTFAPGEVLIREGDEGDCMYVVAVGEVSIRLDGRGELARRQAGESIGEMGIISASPRRATCVAIDDVIALRIVRSDFWTLLEDSRPLALGVITALSRRLDEAVANLRALGPA